MTTLRNTTAILTLAAALTALPVLANAQILGSGLAGQVQGGVNGQIGDTTTPLQGTVQTDSEIKTGGDTTVPQGHLTTDGNVTVTNDSDAVTNAAASGVSDAKSDVNTITGQARDTVDGAVSAATAVEPDVEAKADAAATADIEKK